MLRTADGTPSCRRSPTATAAACTPLEFGPRPGDRRLLVGHERRGREELLIWDVAADTETELDLDLPGEVTAGWYPDGSALLVGHTTPPAPGCTATTWPPATLRSSTPRRASSAGATARPDGTVELPGRRPRSRR